MYQRAAYQRLQKLALEKHADLIKTYKSLPNQIIFNKLRLLFKAGFYVDVYLSDNLDEYSFHAQFERRIYRWDRNHYHGKHEHVWREAKRISLKNEEGINDTTLTTALGEIIKMLRKWIKEDRIP